MYPNKNLLTACVICFATLFVSSTFVHGQNDKTALPASIAKLTPSKPAKPALATSLLLAKTSASDSDTSDTQTVDTQTVDTQAADTQTAAPGTTETGFPVDGRAVTNALMALTAGHPIDGATAMIILLVGSFVVHRCSAIILWLLSLTGFWQKYFAMPSAPPTSEAANSHSIAEAKRVAIYYFFATVVTFFLMNVFCEIQLLSALGFTSKNPVVDLYLTGAIMIIGARRVGHWLDLPGIPGEEPENSKPVLVTGELVLREPILDVDTHAS